MTITMYGKKDFDGATIKDVEMETIHKQQEGLRMSGEGAYEEEETRT